MTNPVSDERRAGLRIVIENDPYLMDHERADLLALLDAPPAPTSEERREMARIINSSGVKFRYMPKSSINIAKRKWMRILRSVFTT